MAHTETPGDHLAAAVRHETSDADLGGAERIIVLTVVLLAVAAAIVWGMFTYLREEALRNDPRPLPIAQQRRGDRLPPLPRLQKTPSTDLQQFHAAEDAALNTYEWVDRPRGVARIPLSRAIDIVAEKGLPHWTAPAPAAGGPPQGTAAAGAGAPPTAQQVVR